MICGEHKSCTTYKSLGKCKECGFRKGYTVGRFLDNIPKIECPDFNTVNKNTISQGADSYRVAGVSIESKDIGRIMMLDTGGIKNVVGFDNNYDMDELSMVPGYIDEAAKGLKISLNNTKKLFEDMYNCKVLKNNVFLRQDIIAKEKSIETKEYIDRYTEAVIDFIKIRISEQEDGTNRPIMFLGASDEFKRYGVYCGDCGDTFNILNGRAARRNVIKLTDDSTIESLEVITAAGTIIIDGIFVYKKTNVDITVIGEWKKSGLVSSKELSKICSSELKLNSILDVCNKYRDGIAPYWLVKPNVIDLR